MKTMVIKTCDGLEFVGKVAIEDAERRKTGKDFHLKWEGDPVLLLVEDPLEIRYRMVDTVPSAVFMKYNAYGSDNKIHLNAASIVSMYEISDHYGKIYEESIKTIGSDKTGLADGSDKEAREALSAALTKLMSNTSIH